MNALMRPSTHRIIKCCLPILTLLLISCGPSATEKTWQFNVFDPVSNATRVIQASDVANKLLVINYWAEWCKPCISEIPELNHFASIHQDTLIVLGVNFDNKQENALQAAMHKVGMRFPAITDNPADIFALPDIGGLPTTLILDEHGVLKKQLLGPQTLVSLEAVLLNL